MRETNPGSANARQTANTEITGEQYEFLSSIYWRLQATQPDPTDGHSPLTGCGFDVLSCCRAAALVMNKLRLC
eukprot:3177094-Amphidinium_carterae.1